MDIPYSIFKACEPILKNCTNSYHGNVLEVCKYRGNQVLEVNDGHRLAIINLDCEAFFPFSIVPRDALQVIKAFKPVKPTSIVTLHFSQVEGGNILIRSTSVSGTVTVTPPVTLELSTVESGGDCWGKVAEGPISNMESYTETGAPCNLDYLHDAVKMASVLSGTPIRSPHCRVIGPDNLSAHVALPGMGSHHRLFYLVMPMSNDKYSLPLWTKGEMPTDEFASALKRGEEGTKWNGN